MKKLFAILLIMLMLVPAAIAEGWSWSSSDESVVRVWPDGSIVVAGVGTATLTARDGTGETVTITLVVPEAYAAQDSVSPYIGNAKTKKLHHFDCTSVNDMNEGNKVRFASREEAVEEGYAPCQRCKP